MKYLLLLFLVGLVGCSVDVVNNNYDSMNFPEIGIVVENPDSLRYTVRVYSPDSELNTLWEFPRFTSLDSIVVKAPVDGFCLGLIAYDSNNYPVMQSLTTIVPTTESNGSLVTIGGGEWIDGAKVVKGLHFYEANPFTEF